MDAPQWGDPLLFFRSGIPPCMRNQLISGQSDWDAVIIHSDDEPSGGDVCVDDDRILIFTMIRTPKDRVIPVLHVVVENHLRTQIIKRF